MMARLPECSVDAIVCDPPYGLEFMGKEWDTFKTGPEYKSGIHSGQGAWKAGFTEVSYRPGLVPPNFSSNRNPVCTTCHKHKRGNKSCICTIPTWDETRADSSRLYQTSSSIWATSALRVLKPGGFLLAFGAPRTAHRMVCAIEDAGFTICGSIEWMYAQGMNKVGMLSKRKGLSAEERKALEGIGGALKPAHEPICIAQRPIGERTIHANILKWGVGAYNVDACRVNFQSETDRASAKPAGMATTKARGCPKPDAGRDLDRHSFEPNDNGTGRWPPDVVLSHSSECRRIGTQSVKSNGHSPSARGTSGYSGGWTGQDGLTERKSGKESVEAWECAPGCPVRELDAQSGSRTSGARSATSLRHSEKARATYNKGWAGDGAPAYGRDVPASTGGASRFYPTFSYSEIDAFRFNAKASKSDRNLGADGHYAVQNTWPTVKPIALMEWLIRLVTPRDGVVLDPFLGSGTTGVAAAHVGCNFVGIDKDDEAIRLSEKRLGVKAMRSTK
ncbi:MAG: site-specific DNA-methyltransferase [Pseudomonadota bacterium]